MPNPYMMNNTTSASMQPSPIFPLPLNLIALIISQIDRPSDLARMCSTCRVFHYMTLPQLYSNVSLRSYDYIRLSQRDGRPEGCGMASPFTMGLNGLASRNVASYVKDFEVCGEWKEYELQEHARVGRVPDGSMMLNTLVRVAIERMAILDNFSWKLNMKMLPTVWQGLSQRSSLTRLTVKFPSERHPRPITLIPPIPNLQYLHIFDIDPLCYIDDISLLLLESKRLRDLKMHWNPRIREAHEPSILPDAYFGRCAAAHYPLPLRSLSVQNLYSRHTSDCGTALDLSQLQEITFLNSTGGINDDGAAAFLENTRWSKRHKRIPTQLKFLRVDKVSHEQCQLLSGITGLEKLYLIGPQSRTRQGSKDQTNGTTPFPNSPTSNTSSPNSTSEANNIASLKVDYITAIIRSHGPTLTHLLLLPQWRLTNDDIALIIRQCPNLIQLGIGVESANFNHLRLLVPFLSNLTCLRLLGNPDDASFVAKMRELDEKGLHEEKIREETGNAEGSRLKWVELGGEDLIFEIGKRESVDAYDAPGDGSQCVTNGTNEKATKVWRRPVWKRSWESVRHIDIWKMDSYDLDV